MMMNRILWTNGLPTKKIYLFLHLHLFRQQHQHQQFNGKRRKRKPLLMMDLKENQFLVGYNRMENMIAITLVEQSRRSTDDRSNCLATCVQVNDLIELNRDLCLLSSSVQEIQNHFEPVRQLLEQFSLGTNTTFYYIRYLFGWTASQEDIIRLESAIRNYLHSVADHCGLDLLRLLLFDRQQLEDCEENVQQLRLQSYEMPVEKALQELNDVVAMRKRAANLLSISELYKIEDQIVDQVFEALGELYFNQLRPFLRMRELSLQRIDQLDSIIECKHFGPKIKRQAEMDHNEHREYLLSATSAIQQLYVDYYGRMVGILAGQVARAVADQKRYGRNAIERAGANNRLDRLRRQVCLKRIEHLNCRKSILETSGSDKQQLFQLRLEILVERQSSLRLDLAQLLAKSQSSNFDAIDFYDAVESPEHFDVIDKQLSAQSEMVRTEIGRLKEKMARNAQQQARLRLELAKLQIKSNDQLNQPLSSSRDDKTKLKRFRRETLIRLKRFRVKQMLYEQQHDKQSDSEEEFQDCIDDTVQSMTQSIEPSNLNRQTEPITIQTAPTIVPSIDVPISAIPPPPPPPPPPLFDLSIKPLVLHKSPSRSSAKPQNSNAPATISLDEILKMRQKLRPAQDSASSPSNKDRATSCNHFENLLKSTLRQIRTVVEDDSISDQDSDDNSFND
ncbi:hypothetical protein DERP_009150 [Dermatophagoides pteronyssinus]|uniref:JMY/WHAMM middle domain-containing protein n=1 Tax=Dermatophagoides pteronyssinus TaxID=6956 RepID=A0ABQ8JQN7_DERPT|nr:hypothetical protein DERP_009150 [Dermatophagoides pteronyssinus]